MAFHVNAVISDIWIAFVAIWLAGAFTNKRMARAQSRSSRLLLSALGVLAAVIGFTKQLDFGWLARAFLPPSPAIVYWGLGLVLGGIGFAVWARLYLGGNWSATIEVKENHTLVMSGPYALVRHPIYSGIMLALLGTAVAYREVRLLVTDGLFLLMFGARAHIEERFMTDEFGLEYSEYKKRVKALIPFVW